MPAPFHSGALAPYDRLSVDVGVPHPQRVRVRDVVRVAFVAILATLVIATLLFLPLAAGEIARLDAVVAGGVAKPAAVLLDSLRTLFFGLLVLSGAIVAFALSVLLTPSAPQPVFPPSRRWQRRAEQNAVRTNPILSGGQNVRPV
ncbi:hypothetical protein [Stappia sp. ES.058]|uniref:hypothetical protein n=1 Tax=Stappia sp. ES.058 TaxID=1881061 RepID=UPI00087A2741|nr:hypothetical protein [Stappia sp. ES.058]SDU29755.1 hypothetical protein SAMN05428979_2815 [Stappia sp. ES.058]